MEMEPEYPFADQGRRLKLLRLAQRFDTGTGFAKFLNWNQSGYSQFETGARKVPADKAIQLSKAIPGFNPLWLWEGDKRGLSYELLQRLEEEEAKELRRSA